LFRDQAEPLLFKPMLSVDGVELGRLSQNRFIAVELSAGPHQLEARWPSVAGHKPATLTVSVTAGATS
jgi:hypothetical protein